MESIYEVDVIGLVQQHFNRASPADAALIWNAVKGYGFDDARLAIEKHRIESGTRTRPDIARIRQLAAGTYVNRGAAARAKVRVVDELRQMEPKYHELSDKDVIIAHFGGCWGDLEANKSLDHRGVAIVRAFIMSSARRSCQELSMPEKESDDLAHELVGLKPGQKIPQQGIWENKSDAKTSFQALKDLAAAGSA